MCSGYCDALPGVLVCTFNHVDDALKTAKSIKVDWEAVSVFEDFDIKLHDALYGRRRTYDEKKSGKCASGHSVSRNVVADLEVVLCYGDLWHFGGHGLFGQEISIAYNLLKERCFAAAKREKDPENMVKAHHIYATMSAFKILRSSAYVNSLNCKLETSRHHVHGRPVTEQLTAIEFKNELDDRDAERIRHRVNISISRGFQRTLDTEVNAGEDYELLNLLSARRICNTKLSAAELDHKIYKSYIKNRYIVSVALHGGPLPWDTSPDRKGDHSAVGMFPGSCFHAHTKINTKNANHTTARSMIEYARNVLAFKIVIRNTKACVRRLDLGVAPHAIILFDDIISAMDVCRHLKVVFEKMKNDSEDEFNNRIGPCKGELSIAVSYGPIYDFHGEDIYGEAATKARLLSEVEDISGKHVLDDSVIKKDEEILNALYKVDRTNKKQCGMHNGSLYFAL
eukprot:g7192.t1